MTGWMDCQNERAESFVTLSFFYELILMEETKKKTVLTKEAKVL